MKKRNTKQKKLIEGELQKIRTFFSAEELHERIKKHDPSLGLATIYRYLNELKKQNKIFSYQCDRRTIYSSSDKSHCHFICEETGKIIHFDIDSIDFLKKKIPGDITSFQLEVRGICKECK